MWNICFSLKLGSKRNTGLFEMFNEYKLAYICFIIICNFDITLIEYWGIETSYRAQIVFRQI